MPNRSIVPGTPPDPDTTGPAFRRLCDVIAQLRSVNGCPWDRVQTLETIKPHTLEETYELLEAIDSGDDKAIVEELGDVLLQVLLDAQIGADSGRFHLQDVIQCLTDKMIRRHPHVFGDAVAMTAADVTAHWNHAKSVEKSQRTSQLDGIPAALPQLTRARKISARAADVGYDFPHRVMLFAKLREELDELAAELFPDGVIPDMPASVDVEVTPDQSIAETEHRGRVANELGDVLFVVANIARRWKIDPEEALRASNRKFIRRFQGIERELERRGRDVYTASLAEMEDCYQAEKQREQQDAARR